MLNSIKRLMIVILTTLIWMIHPLLMMKLVMRRMDQHQLLLCSFFVFALKISYLLQNLKLFCPGGSLSYGLVSHMLAFSRISEVTKNENSAMIVKGCGARIGIMAKPSPEFVAGVLGTWFSGGVAISLALSYLESELLHDISVVLSTEDYCEVMRNVAAKTGAKFSLLPLVSNISSETTLNS